MYKNKKGFTLIELLAVIIVLIIIILIAINAIKKNIDDTLDNATVANAGVYVKAVNSFVSVESIENSDFESGAFGVSDLTNLGVNVSGTKPDGGYVIVENSEVIRSCLTYDTYYVEYINGDFSKVKKGACNEFSNVMNFAYTGKEQVYEILANGVYKLEVWGAQGGGSIKNAVSNPSSSYGGYSIGYVSLNAGDKLYVNVGGKGTDAIVGQDVAGGYNGGGIGTWDHKDDEAAGGGGGATHIATERGLLSTLSAKVNSVLIVAGGAGGKSWDTDGGNGGGYVALPSGDGRVANQLSGYQFGKGQDAVGTGDSDGHGGGGGGFYGGYESSTNDEDEDFGGGGSGYIGNSSLYDKMMYCYGCEQQLSDTGTFTVNTVGNSAYIDSELCPLGYNSNPVSKCAKSGDGFARVSFVSGN